MTSLPIWLGSVLTALVIVSLMVFSDRFSRYGLAGWKTALLGMVLIFFSFLARAVLSIDSFAELFMRGIPEFVAHIADIVVAIGATVVAMSVFVAVRRLAIDKESDKQKESQLQFLDNLKNIIFEPYSLVEVLNFSLNEISRTLDDCGGAIFIYNPSARDLYLTSSIALDQAVERNLERISIGGDIISRTQKMSRSHAVGKMTNSDKATQALLAGRNVVAALTAPLMSRNGPVGVIAIFGQQPYQFSRRESEILSSAANLLGPVIASFRMEREIRRLNDRVGSTVEKSRRQLEIIGELGGKNSKLENIGILLEHAEEIVHGDGSLLTVCAADAKWRILRSTDDSTFDIDISENFARHFEKAVSNGKPIIVKSTTKDGEQSRFLVFPVETGTSETAVLLASVSSGRESFTSDEINQLQLVLKLIGMLIPHADESAPEVSVDADEFTEAFRSVLQSTSVAELANGLEKVIYATMPEFDAGMLIAVDTDRRYMRVCSSFGYDGRRVADFKLETGGGPWGRAVRLGAEVFCDERKELDEMFLSLAANELTWFMERVSGRRLPAYCRAVPLAYRGQNVGVLFVEGADDAVQQKSDSVSDKMLLDLLAFKMKQVSVGSGAIKGLDQLPLEGDAVYNLNQMNNILTGIIGKAQLLGFGLRDDEMREKDSVLLNLDMVADEAFQAGEIVKKLQRAIRKEEPENGEPSTLNLSELLQNVSIVRYGSDPHLHYLRENPAIAFETDLSETAEARGSIDEVRPLLNEVIQYAWDEFGVDERMVVALKDKGDYSYLTISDETLSEEESNVDNYSFRPIGMHPDLSQSDIIADARNLGVSYHDDTLQDGVCLLCLRFDHSAVDVDETSESLFSILAIDDQEIIRELLSGMLIQLGYSVTVCSSGIEGVEAFEKKHYDLVITDIGLPDIDGWAVAEKIRGRVSDIPIIMISGWGLGQEVEKASQMGIDHILPKPFRLENLSELIEKVKSRKATA